MDNEKIVRKGGKREGSGRKKLDATMISFRMHNSLLQTLDLYLNDKRINRTDYINKAIEERMLIDGIITDK